jgi:hypothetical protein
MVCEPQPKHFFGTIEYSCVILFTIDYVVRISNCWLMPTRLAGVVPEIYDRENIVICSETGMQLMRIVYTVQL